jgi:hypothetical protein
MRIENNNYAIATPDPSGFSLLHEIDGEKALISKEKHAARRYEKEMEKLR